MRTGIWEQREIQQRFPHPARGLPVTPEASPYPRGRVGFWGTPEANSALHFPTDMAFLVNFEQNFKAMLIKATGPEQAAL